MLRKLIVEYGLAGKSRISFKMTMNDPKKIHFGTVSTLDYLLTGRKLLIVFIVNILQNISWLATQGFANRL